MRNLEELLDKWPKNNGCVVCSYDEYQVLSEFLIIQETPFKVSYKDNKIIVKRAM